MLWDTSSLTNLKTETIDSSSCALLRLSYVVSSADGLFLGRGVIMPFYAEGNDVLILAGKG